MALTGTQRAEVRLYLGWSARFRQFDSALEGALSALETEPESEALVIAQLDELKRIDDAVRGAESRLKAEQVGAIRLPQHREIRALRSRGRQEVGRLAAILGIDVRQDVFSDLLPAQRASHAGLVGPGNYQRQG